MRERKKIDSREERETERKTGIRQIDRDIRQK